MNSLASIGILVQHINAKRSVPIGSLSFHQDTQHFQLFISILTLARNLKVNDGNITSPLMLLQKLSIITANLVNFAPLNRMLAQFNRKSFQDQCRHYSKQIRSLGGMVYGIYPLIKSDHRSTAQQSKQFQHLDQINDFNPNWKLTRQVLTKMAEQSNGEQKECLQILLGLPSLTHPQYLQQEWRPLWTTLYRWTVIFLTSNEKQQQRDIRQWELAVHQTMEQLNLKGSSSNESYWQSLILSMLGFIVKQFLFEDKHCLEIKQAKDYFQKIPKQFFPSTCYYAQITILLRDLFHDCRLEQCTAFCDEHLKNIIKQLGSDSTQQHTKDRRQKVLLTSYLLPKEQLPNYLKIHHLPFWNYGLDQNLNESLAAEYLLNSNWIQEDIEWDKVFQFVHSEIFRKHVFGGQKEWTQHLWAQRFIDLCQSHPQFFLQKVKQSCNQQSRQQLTKALQLFGQQWRCFQRLNLQEELNQNVVAEAEKVLSFDFEIISSFRKMSRFPQDSHVWFINLCKSYFNYFSSSPISQLQIIFSPSFVRNLLAIEKSQLLSSFWSEWSDYLLGSNKIIESLLMIGGDLDSTLDTNSLELGRP